MDIFLLTTTSMIKNMVMAISNDNEQLQIHSKNA
jgi:hypothetical protein